MKSEGKKNNQREANEFSYVFFSTSSSTTQQRAQAVTLVAPQRLTTSTWVSEKKIRGLVKWIQHFKAVWSEPNKNKSE